MSMRQRASAMRSRVAPCSATGRPKATRGGAPAHRRQRAPGQAGPSQLGQRPRGGGGLARAGAGGGAVDHALGDALQDAGHAKQV